MELRHSLTVFPRKLQPAAGLALAAASALLLLLAACMVGPKYQRPSAPVPAAYKEAPPPNFKEAGPFQPAQPNDAAARGRWWEIYKDPQLNALEEQVGISNQNVLLAEAQFRQAQEAARVARSSLFPTVTGSPAISTSRTSGSLFNVNAGNLTSGERNTYNLPISVSYLADIWGSIRRSARAGAETAQASFAQLENARLAYQAALAQDYFELHGSDGAQALLQRTVASYQDSLQLTKDRFSSGVASGADVAQAQTQLEGARAQMIDLGVARAQLEHAIAILTGKPPVALSIPPAPNHLQPPPVPVGLPSTLLERRPDIAAAERQMAAANEQIGIARAAYYPSLTLSATGGFESGSISQWLTWPSRFWSLGPTLAETLFEGGRRRALVAEQKAAYDATVATYRQTVLNAFQQVEDNLAALRILEGEAAAEDAAVRAAQQSLEISTYQYKAGTVDYLTVLTEQTILLGDQVQAVNISTRRLTASVLLMEALGGGWNASAVPTAQQIVRGK